MREHGARTVLVDALIYGEAISVAGRHDQPLEARGQEAPADRVHRVQRLREEDAQRELHQHQHQRALSFVSGHASTAGAVWGTATYLAFSRSPHSWRPVGHARRRRRADAFVSIERVRSGDHFPTDVVAGSFAGAGVGVLTAHFHRDESSKLQPLWVGWQNATLGDGGELTVNGLL